MEIIFIKNSLFLVSFLYFYRMKKIALILLSSCSTLYYSQFNVTINSNQEFSPKEVYFYTLNGSKEILISKEIKKNNQFTTKYPKNYVGMMRAYFPENNFSLNFISENKDVKINITSKDSKISNVEFLDETNKVMNEVQGFQRKKDNILPVLVQMKDFYSPNSEFHNALLKEINSLSKDDIDTSRFPFIDYYNKNYNLFGGTKVKVPQDDILKFITNSNEYLETSSLMRPLLINYLNNGSSKNIEESIDKLLSAVNVETPRGQTVLSEFIELFDAYGMTSLKEKYLSKAKNLTCTINDRLSGTIESNKKIALGATFQDYNFVSPFNTSAKSIHSINTDKKIIVFWSSTCSHCETELPKFIPHYNQLKAKNVEIIGLSLDSDKASYSVKASAYPWISDSELKGWNSSVAEKYNVKATPSFFILDKNNVIVSKPDRVSDVLEYFGIK